VSKVLERKFPGRRLVFIFDHSPIHRTKADDALNASETNVGPEGAQPLMRDGFGTISGADCIDSRWSTRRGEPKACGRC
jgi:hypothetical protein